MEYHFQRDGHFFDDIVAFSVPLIGMMALVRFPDLKDQIDFLIARGNALNQGRKLPGGRLPNIVIPDNAVVLGKVVDCTLLHNQAIATAIQVGQPLPPLVYVDQNLLEKDTKTLRTYPTPDSILPTVARVTLGSAYERTKEAIHSTLGNLPSSWPPIFQYFRHCRNAAFHGNHFDVWASKRAPGIDTAKPPAWRTSTMPDDATMNSMTLIGDLLEAGDIPILLGDVALELETLGIGS